MAGRVYSDWDYKLEADFVGTTQAGSTNNVTVTDAYVRYNGLKPYAFTAGNFKVPFNLEAVVSAKYLTFMERGLPFAFLTLGAMASANGDNWTAAVGLFDRVLHLGASGNWVRWLALWITTITIGWIERGFLGIPRGRDHRS